MNTSLMILFVIFFVLIDIIIGQTPMARKEGFNPDKIPLNYHEFHPNNYYESNWYSNNQVIYIYFIGFILLFISIFIGLYNCSIIKKISNNNNLQQKINNF